MRHIRQIALTLALALLVLAPAARAAPNPTIVVTLRDASVQLSRDAVLVGKVTFRIVNDGRRAHDFAIGGKRIARVAPHGTARLTVAFGRPGTFIYTSGKHRGALTVERPAGPTTIVNPPNCPAPRPTTVTVAMAGSAFRLSQTTVPCGIVTFLITNEGNDVGEDEPNSFYLNAKGGNGPTLLRGQSAKLVVSLAPGKYSYTAGNYESNYEGQYGTLVVTG